MKLTKPQLCKVAGVEGSLGFEFMLSREPSFHWQGTSDEAQEAHTSWALLDLSNESPTSLPQGLGQWLWFVWCLGVHGFRDTVFTN